MTPHRDDQTNLDPPSQGKASGETLTVPPKSDFAVTVGLGSIAVEPIAGGRAFGDYELLAELARGGMGVVYKARQISLNRVVALKMILSGRLASAADVQRFQQEAEAAANLDHSNILPIYDVGDHDGQHFFSMKLVEGDNLSDRVETLVADSRAAVSLMERIARGVYFAHQRGILHRDLKPANILIDADGTPYVTDFGLAKKTQADSSLTQSGAIVGTPSYMAPEQARGAKGITTAVDIYSLGAILYELLTSRAPFKGDSVAQTLRMVEEHEPVPPRRLKSTCDPDLEAISLKCLEKDPARRYETAGAMADDLRRWLDGESVSARRASAGRRAMKWVKRNPAVAGLTALCAVVLVGGAGVSSYYAIQAAKQSRLTAAEADRAKISAREAMEASEQAKDALCRGQFEQARSLRLAGQSGWRDKSLDLLKKSAELIVRAAGAANPEFDLPAIKSLVSEMRTEAVLALQRTTPRLVRELPGNAAMPTLFSQDGRRLIQSYVVDPETLKSALRVVDLTSGTTTNLELVGDANDAISALFQLSAINGDGTRIAIIIPGTTTIQIQEFPTFRKVLVLEDPSVVSKKEAPVNFARLRYSADGSRVAAIRRVGQEAQIVVWDLKQPTTPRVILRQPIEKKLAADFTKLAEDDRDLAAFRFTPDSKRLSFTSPDRKSYRVVDISVDPPKVVADVPISIHFHSAEWHPKEDLLAITENSGLIKLKVFLWDVRQRVVRASCGDERSFNPEAQGKSVPVAFSPNGEWLAIGGVGSIVHVHRVVDGTEELRFDTATTIAFGVNRLVWTANNDLVTTEFLSGVKVWRLDVPSELVSFPQFQPLDRPAFSPDGRWLAVFAPSGELTLTNLPAGRRRFGNILSKDRIALIDRKTNEVVRYLPGSDTVDGRLIFSPDSQRIVLERLTDIDVRNLAGEVVLNRSIKKGDKLSKYSDTFFGPDGRLYTFANAQRVANQKASWSIVLWDVQENRSVPGFPEFATEDISEGESMISDDGSRLMMYQNPALRIAKKQKTASGTDVGQLFEIPSGRRVGTFATPGGNSEEIVFPSRLSSGGRRLLAVHAPASVFRGGNVDFKNVNWKIHDLATGELILQMPNVTKGDKAFDFDPEGHLVALGAEQGYVDLWDVDARQRLFRWQPHGDRTVNFVAVAPDGDIATVAEGEDRLVVLRLAALRARLTEMGLGW